MHNNPPTSAAAEEVYIDSSGRIAHGGTRPPLAFSPPFSPPLDHDAVRREQEEAIARAKEYAASYRASDLALSPRRPTPPSDDECHDQQQAERDPSTTATGTAGRRLLRRRRLWNSGPPPANFDAASMPPLPGVERSFTSAFDVVVNWHGPSSTPVRGKTRPQHEKDDDDDRLQQHEDRPEQDTHPQDPRLDLNVDVVPAAGSSSVSTPTCASPAWETLSDDAYRLTDRQRRKVWEIVEEEAEDRRASESVARRSWRVALLAAAALPLLLPLSRAGRGVPQQSFPVAPPAARFGGVAFVNAIPAQASAKADRELLRETAGLLARQRRRRNDEQEHTEAAVSDKDREQVREIARGEAADRLADLVSRVEA